MDFSTQLITFLFVIVTPVSGKFHCSDHITPEIINSLQSLLLTHKKDIFTGYLDFPSSLNLIPIKIETPPPCGSYTSSSSDLDKFQKTAIQVYRFDPTSSPHLILSLTAVRVTTSCTSHWIGRDEKTITKEVVSTFDRLPQEELSIIKSQLEVTINTFSPGEERLELLSQEIYDCPTWVNPGIKNTYVLRLKLHRAYWSPKGFLISPFLLRNCSLSGSSSFCEATHHTWLYWSSSTSVKSPLYPSMTIGGVLETSVPSNSNELCPGVVRFFSMDSNFELTFSVESITNWEPETYSSERPIFISSEGIFFSFLEHDGQSILSFLCPSWKFETPNRTGRIGRSIIKFSGDLPLDVQPQTLEEEISWVRARVEGHLSHLYNRTVNELVKIHQRDCESKRMIILLAIGLSPLDPRPYLTLSLGHPFFEVTQIKNRRYYKTALPVTDLTFDFRNTSQGHISVSFRLNKAPITGYFSCSKGYIRLTRSEAEEETKNCYLHVHGLGGIDLCTARTTPSSYSGPREGDWLPKIEVPVLKFIDEAYENSLEETSFSYLGPRDFLRSMGHSLLHDEPRWPSLSNYTSMIDSAMYWGPIGLVVFVLAKLFLCFCGGDVSEKVKSRVF